MAISSTRLTSTSLTPIYTSTGNNAITTMVICNTGTPDPADETLNVDTVTIHFVANGNSANDTNTVVKNLVIPAGETVFFSDEKVILGNGDSIQAQATVGNLLSITISRLSV
jgi:hypothetical protein